MMYFQAPPPDTSSYMIGGYTIFAIVMVVYLISLFLRWRNLKQELSLLEEMEENKK